MIHVLIVHEKTPRVLKLHENPEALLYWADILCPGDDYRICETIPEDYEVYSDLELRWLYYNTLKKVSPARSDGTYDRQKLLKDVEYAIDTLLVDHSTIPQLKIKLGHTLDAETLLNLKI